MRRNVALLAGAAAGAVAAIVLSRRGSATTVEPEPAPTPPPPGPDPRAEDLRRKLAEAKAGTADEEDFEAAGMGAETLVEDDSDVSEARKRVHEEARKTAEEMRRAGDDTD